MLQMWVSRNSVNKTNVYFVTLMQVFHIELHVYGNSFIAIMQYCNMFQTFVFGKILNKILMQCSHSRHANVIQVGGYNCNKTKLVCIDANIIFIKT